MRTLSTVPAALLLLTTLHSAPLPAQTQQQQVSPETAAMIKAMTPGSQHAFLAEQVGTWKATLLVYSDPEAPPIEGTGTVERTMILGGRVLYEKLEGQIMGMPFNGVGQLGYDNVTGKYWGTWSDTFITGVIITEGDIDEAAGKGTMIGQAPEPVAGEKVEIRLEIWVEEGKHITEAYNPVPGKGTMLTMKTIYERQ